MKSIKLSPHGPRCALTRIGYGTLAIGALALAGCGTTTASASGSPAGASTTPATSAPAGAGAPAHGATRAPAGFAVQSMTFVSDDQGFALGTGRCGATKCAELLGTSNGGSSWHRLTAPTRQIGGAYGVCPGKKPCVSQIRFATPQLGYAFGPSLYLTTNGGSTWHQVTGDNVTSLEAADGNTVRVASKGEGCSGMPYQVQQATVGTADWRTLAAPKIIMICPPVLYRQGQQLVLAGYGNPAGGVRATAQIARSATDGATWKIGPDQCGGTDGYASAVALAPPNALVLLCQHQRPHKNGTYRPAYLRISANGGTTFGPDKTIAGRGDSPGEILRYQVAAASPSRLLVVVTSEHGSRVLLSQNGGRTWTATLTPDGTGSVLLVGYEDPDTARVAQGDLVWTTRNGGRTWAADHF
jgi:photosystem II stability/assembly factor-like uncharacterized protein